MTAQPLKGRIALITRWNKGIGLEIARQVGMQGITVHMGTRSVEQGARAAVRLATLPADGPTGGFFDEGGRLPW
jgi:NAD(P)-dependent dehydrogenase (short-subunit alcohol dehydrogenase family)